MSANVFTFPGRNRGPQPWTNDELAELYRVVDLLGKAGLSVITDMGMSDEGDPWFVFCRADNEEVIAHFARIDGHFVAASIAVDETFRGANFRQIVDRMVSSQPLVVPKPGTGSRLLLHPAVLLTAFVATALAHSEKMLAQEFMRSVEAQWDHSKAAVLHEIKHLKTGWLDTLNSIWKLPLHDAKLAYDSVKETQALTLVSLIAIAMAALQPIVDKIALITQVIADEFPGHSGAAHSQSAHAAQMALDQQVADMAIQAGDHDKNHTHSSDDAAQAHKNPVPASDGGNGGDGQKIILDAAHAAVAVTTQKVAADEASHVPVAHAVEMADVSNAFLLVQQKVAVAQPVPEAFTVHLDMSAGPTQAINIQDVTPDVWQILGLKHEAPSEKSAGSPASGQTDHSSSQTPPAQTASDAGSTQPTVVSSETSGNTAPSAVVKVPVTGPQEINTATANYVEVINAISNFVTSGTHAISQPWAMNFSSALTQELSSYFAGSNSLKIVVFDTTAPIADIFAFAPGVVFVADRDLTPSAILSNHGGNLTLDTTGGTITLVGVATIDHASV